MAALPPARGFILRTVLTLTRISILLVLLYFITVQCPDLTDGTGGLQPRNEKQTATDRLGNPSFNLLRGIGDRLLQRT